MENLKTKLTEIYKDVYYFTVSRVRDDEQAKDITQSVMETALVKMDTLRNKKSLRPWVMQIAHNQINAYYNSIKRYNRVFVDADPMQTDSIEFQQTREEDIKEDIVRRLTEKEDLLNIMRALDRLEMKYREVIRLNIICEYSLVEVAEIMNANVNTVRTWSARGLVKLKEEFDKLDSRGEK